MLIWDLHFVPVSATPYPKSLIIEKQKTPQPFEATEFSFFQVSPSGRFRGAYQLILITCTFVHGPLKSVFGE
jgi:hypothetical protein